MPYDYQKQQALEEARRKDRRQSALNTARDIKNIVQAETPWGMMKMAKKFNLISDWMYGLALVAAVFKDVLDFVEFTGILYIIVIITTLLVSIFIAMMMVLGGKTRMICWIILLVGTAAELLFGVNILPIETITVLIIYALTVSVRKQTKEVYA